jgi:DNA-binding NarL/FixJ family response regulator
MASTCPAPLRILILDRDRQSLQGLRSCLERIPGRRLLITACATVESALQAIAPRHPDLILMEQDLGDETGPRLLAVLRGMQCLSPVIMLSGVGNAQSAVAALRAGATDYLPKATLDPVRLERAMQYALDKTRVEQRLGAQREQLLASHRQLQAGHDELRLGVDLLARDLTHALDALRGFLGAFPDESALSADQSDRLRQAVGHCRGLRHLVVDLGMHLTVDPGAFEGGALEGGAAITTAPRDLLAQALPSAVNAASQRGVTFAIAVPAQLPPVTAPPNIAELLTRLVQFAVDATPDGGAVQVHAAVEAGRLQIALVDGAADRSDEDVDLLLQRLPSGHTPADLDGWRLGLPLRTARAALRRIGGELQVSSRGGALHQQLMLPLASPWALSAGTAPLGAGRA